MPVILRLIFRLIRTQVRSLTNPSKNVLDGDLLWKYKDLSHSERVEFAKKIGTSPDQVIKWTIFLTIVKCGITCFIITTREVVSYSHYKYNKGASIKDVRTKS